MSLLRKGRERLKAVLPRRDGLKRQMRRAAGPGLREPRDATRAVYLVIRLFSSFRHARHPLRLPVPVEDFYQFYDEQNPMGACGGGWGTDKAANWLCDGSRLGV